MNSLTLRRSLLAGALVLIPRAVESKCAFKIYELKVQVRDACTQAPVSGAKVLLFENTEQYAVDMRTSTGEAQKDVASDAAGVASAHFWFSRANGPGIIFADRCNRRLTRLELVVLADNYQPERRQLRGALLQGQGRDRGVRLPSQNIDLRPIDDSDCCHSDDTAPVPTGPPNPSLQRTTHGRSPVCGR